MCVGGGHEDRPTGLPVEAQQSCGEQNFSFPVLSQNHHCQPTAVVEQTKQPCTGNCSLMTTPADVCTSCSRGVGLWSFLL